MTKKKKKDEEVWVLTPRGLLSMHMDSDTLDQALDALELYMRRFHAKEGNAAIILDDDGMLVFGTVEHA